MSENRLPEELEEQAIRHALEVLDPEERKALRMKPTEESSLRQAAMAYQAVTGVLASAVAPVVPPGTLRERLVSHIALEAARETEQFELAANTLALGAAPVKPRALVRDQLLSRIEMHSDAPRGVTDFTYASSEASALAGEGGESRGERPLSQENDSFVTWLGSCRAAISSFLQILMIRSTTSERIRYWKAKITLQQPTKGLTFIRTSEGAWRSIAPGVTAKLLSFDSVSRRTTTLLRFAPGTSYAPHRHAEAEELLVLEGGCSIAGHEMAVGDYHRAEAGTVHHDTSTDEGCLLLVISSPQNELLG